MKRFAEAEGGVVRVPVVVQPIPVEDDLAFVLDEIRGVEVAILVLHEMYEMPSVPLLLEYSQSCIAFGIVMP